MDIKGILFSVAKQLLEGLNAKRCTIRVPENKEMKLVALYGNYNDLKREELVKIEGTIVGEAFLTGNVLNIPDITKDNRYNPDYISYNDPTSLLAVPLEFENEILGVAQIYTDKPFTEKEINLAKTLSQFAALTIFHERFRKTIRKSFLKIIETIMEGRTFEEIAQKAVEQITKNLQIERCTVYRVFKENNQLFCEISAGIPTEEHGIGLKEELDKHPDIKAIIENKKINIIYNPEENPLTFHFIEIIKAKRINTILYIPTNENVALVVDATKEKKFFTEEEIEFCEDVSYILNLVLKRIKRDLQTFRDLTINPAVSIGGWAKRIAELAKVLKEEAERLTKNIPEKI